MNLYIFVDSIKRNRELIYVHGIDSGIIFYVMNLLLISVKKEYSVVMHILKMLHS